MRYLLKRVFKKHDNEGFTLLELSIAVGILLILTLGGITGYSQFSKSSEKAALNQAARTVYNAAAAYQTDTSKTPQDAETEYNNTQDSASGKKHIVVDVVESDGAIGVSAWFNNDPENKVSVSTGVGDGSITPGIPGGDNGGTPVIEDTITSMTFRCDETRSAPLAFYGLSADSKITIQEKGNDESLKFIEKENFLDDFIYRNILEPNPGVYTKEEYALILDETFGQAIRDTTGLNVSYVDFMGDIPVETTLNAGITYQVQVDGKFNTFQNYGLFSKTPDCLRSVEKIGKDSNVKQLVFGSAIEDVPDEIPSSVLSLGSAFYQNKIFNDPDIKNWDLQNVLDTTYMFYGAESFNQDLGNWNTANVKDMSYMFYEATSYDNGGVSLNMDTSKVEDMSHMFRNASAFNNGGSSLNWDVSNVTRMVRMFNNATSFNQPLRNAENDGPWDTGNVTNVNSMFYGSAFRQDISDWNVSKVSSRISFAPSGFPSGYLPKF